MNIGVVGLGNIGRATAAYLSLLGHDVIAWDGLENVRDHFIENGCIINITGAMGEKESRLNRICRSLRDLVTGTDMIFICVPAFLHRPLALEMAPHLRDHLILLQPGSTMGAVDFYNALESGNRSLSGTIVMESQSTLFVSRIADDDESVRVAAVKKILKVAAFPGRRTAEGVERLKQVINDISVRKEPSVIKTSFDNPNAMIHPPGMIFNLPRIDGGKKFHFYSDGITGSVAEIIDQMEAERGAVMAEFGIEITTIPEWIEEVYGHGFSSTHEAVTNNPAYREIIAPDTVEHRYILEDVPMGLVPMACIGERMGVPTPVMDSLITISSVLVGRDLRASGRNLAALGLENAGKQELIEMFGVNP